MFSWLFGGSSKKQAQSKASLTQVQEIAQNDLWMYDCLSQYLQSPLWSIPILDFLENNCIYFDQEEQNKFQYTKIFNNFRDLVASMVDNMIQQIGISQALLQSCIKKGLRSKHRKIFEQILVCDNFLAFKKIMIKKNKELQIEAIKQIQLYDKNFAKSDEKVDELELERLEMEKAIAISLAVKDKIDDEEQKLIQEAIKQSELQQQLKLEKQVKNLQISEKKHLNDLPPLISTIKKQPIQQLQKQSLVIEAQLGIQRQKRDKEQQKEKQDAEQRKKRLIEQRELLRKKKQTQRKNELAQFVQGKQESSTNSSKISQEQLVRRKNLMQKLKQQLE